MLSDSIRKTDLVGMVIILVIDIFLGLCYKNSSYQTYLLSSLRKRGLDSYV